MKAACYFLRHLALMLDFFGRGWWIALSTKDPLLTRQRNIQNTSRIARKFLKAFQIDLRVKHPERLTALQDTPYLLVANHVSYTDIILLASLEKLVFITSVEMGSNPLLGAITRLGGSLYTDRKRPVSLKHEIQNFSDAIAQGFKVVLFPEGTSTDGKTVGSFRRSLFQIALNVNCPILPVCIKYISIDGQEISDNNRDLICWYGDMSFAPHFMKLLGRKINVEIEILESILQPQEKTRSELSEAVYRQIHDSYHQNRKSI
jgi:lyso-ornithine lipid O-acyltransferase